MINPYGAELRFISVQLPKELRDELEQEADERHLTLSAIARERLSRKSA